MPAIGAIVMHESMQTTPIHANACCMNALPTEIGKKIQNLLDHDSLNAVRMSCKRQESLTSKTEQALRGFEFSIEFIRNNESKYGKWERDLGSSMVTRRADFIDTLPLDERTVFIPKLVDYVHDMISMKPMDKTPISYLDRYVNTCLNDALMKYEASSELMDISNKIYKSYSSFIYSFGGDDILYSRCGPQTSNILNAYFFIKSSEQTLLKINEIIMKNHTKV